ncbi:MAG TPA: STAS domain-containing protein [Kofleriaceae bacterium]
MPYELKKAPDGTPELWVKGQLDINTAPALSDTIDELAATHPAKVVADLSGLDLIDSSGVAALVKLYKYVRNNGGTVVIRGARDQPLAIFKLLRMDRVFNL